MNLNTKSSFKSGKVVLQNKFETMGSKENCFTVLKSWWKLGNFGILISTNLPAPIPVLAILPSSSVKEESCSDDWSDDSLELSSSVPKKCSSSSGKSGAERMQGNSSGDNAATAYWRATGLSASGVWRSALPLVEWCTDEGKCRTFGFLGTGGGTWKLFSKKKCFKTQVKLQHLKKSYDQYV